MIVPYQWDTEEAASAILNIRMDRHVHNPNPRKSLATEMLYLGFTLEGELRVNDLIAAYSPLQVGSYKVEGSVTPSQAVGVVRVRFQDALNYYRNKFNTPGADILAAISRADSIIMGEHNAASLVQ